MLSPPAPRAASLSSTLKVGVLLSARRDHLVSATAPRNGGPPSAYSGRCAVGPGDPDNPGSDECHSPCWQAQSRMSAEACGMNRRQSGALGCSTNQVVHRLPGQRLATFGNEQPRQPVCSQRKVAPECSQLIASDRLLDRQPALEALHPQPSPMEIDLLAAEGDCFADPQAVPEHHEQQQRVSHAMPASLRRIQQSREFALAEEILSALMSVRRNVRGGRSITFYLLPVGRPHRHRQIALRR